MGHAGTPFTRFEQIKLFAVTGACALGLVVIVFGVLFGGARAVGFI